jgi:hypothetical protein
MSLIAKSASVLANHTLFSALNSEAQIAIWPEQRIIRRRAFHTHKSNDSR